MIAGAIYQNYKPAVKTKLSDAISRNCNPCLRNALRQLLLEAQGAEDEENRCHDCENHQVPPEFRQAGTAQGCADRAGRVLDPTPACHLGLVCSDERREQTALGSVTMLELRGDRPLVA